MVINVCKHDGGFLLDYSHLTCSYKFVCVRCQVFKLPFSPDYAGKVRIKQVSHMELVEAAPQWRDFVVSYPEDPSNALIHT